MAKKNIVIWGAGRIGRGFIADLFWQSGYKVTFVDQSEKLVNGLKQKASYSVILADGKQERQVHAISGYDALTTAQTEEIQVTIDQTDLIAVAVYPDIFPAAASTIAEYILKRRAARQQDPIDILLCTNLIHAGPKFKGFLLDTVNEPTDKQFLNDKVGVIESLVIRICPDPAPEDIALDPLVVLTNGYPILPVDKTAFKTTLPPVASLRLVEDMRAEEMRKIYTYNMCHAVLSYHGAMRGHKLLVQCLQDATVRAEAEKALAESNQALQKEYGFSPEEMRVWIDGVIDQTNNPLIGDTVERSAADPRRKLAHDDRLIGPALMCLKHGITPSAIARAAGAAFHYKNPADAGSVLVQDTLTQKGIDASIKLLCGIETGELFEAIKLAFRRIPLEIEWQKKAAEAERLGYYNEEVFHGCGQCAIAALMDVLDINNDGVFESATALSGGIANVGDGCCSAYIAGVMAIGMLYPRHRDHFDGGRENKYRSFEVARELRQKYLDTYGSFDCNKIHENKYGRTFDLRLAEDRTSFEAAGAHSSGGCTETVAKACRWTIEVITEDQIRKQLNANQQ